MQTDLLDQITEINPLPEDLPAPPIEALPALDAPDPREVARPAAKAHPRFPKRVALALPVAAVVVILALLGQGGGSQFDVAAAVYNATLAGNGVHYMYLEGHGSGVTTSYQRWSTTHPRSERALIDTDGHVTELASGGGFESAWSTEHARTIFHGRGSAPVSKWDPVRIIQQAYSAGRLRVLGKTAVGTHAAYRAIVTSPHGETGTSVIVDAHSFMPIELIYHRPGGGPPTLVIHVRSYEELPPTSANLALLRIAPHPGARYVTVVPQHSRSRR